MLTMELMAASSALCDGSVTMRPSTPRVPQWFWSEAVAAPTYGGAEGGRPVEDELGRDSERDRRRDVYTEVAAQLICTRRQLPGAGLIAYHEVEYFTLRFACREGCHL